jgi:hypothetical protein
LSEGTDSAGIAGMVRRHEREEGLLVLRSGHGMRWLRVQEVPCVEEETMSSDMRSSENSVDRQGRVKYHFSLKSSIFLLALRNYIYTKWKDVI